MVKMASTKVKELTFICTFRRSRNRRRGTRRFDSQITLALMTNVTMKFGLPYCGNLRVRETVYSRLCVPSKACRAFLLVFANSTRSPDTPICGHPPYCWYDEAAVYTPSSYAVKSKCSSFPRYRALGATLVEQLVVRRITESDHQI